jgi:hypothetical protein
VRDALVMVRGTTRKSGPNDTAGRR